jgi:S1-C subfamily serine protease
MSASSPSFVSALQPVSDALADLVDALAPSLVSVHAGGRSDPSGFVWRDGLVVTTDEALAGEDDLTVTGPSGGKVKATLVGRDPSTDVALLRIPEGTGAPVPTMAAAPPRVGALAIGVGRTSTGPLAAWGVVAQVGPAWRSRQGGAIDAYLSCDVRLPPRAEGGLIATADGSLLGMAVFGPRRGVLAIPMATVERSAQGLLDGTSRRRGYLGVAIQPVPLPDGSGHGAMALTVDAKGPCGQAGLRQGDVIVAIEGSKVERMRDLMAVLVPEAVGREVALSVLRAGQPLAFRVTVAERTVAP